MRRFFRLLLILILPVAISLAAPPGVTSADNPPTEPLRTAGDRPIDIRHIRLDLRVDLAGKTLAGVATLSFRSLRSIPAITLDAVNFEVQKVTLGKEEETPLHFGNDGRNLVVDLEPAWPGGKEGILRIHYRVRKPKEGLYFFGPTREEPEVPLTVWSQGEPTDNRYWFPCLDQPNQRQTTELVVTAPEGFEVVSNGKLLERRRQAPDRTETFHWLQDKPHPAYLVTLVVGQFDVVRETWDGIPVLYYVPRGQKDQVARSFGHTRDMLSFFSGRFGIRYPWDQYAQVVVEQYMYGGMENTSATTLIDSALQDERSILDEDSDWLISHEMAHQWWGDLVTCRDWSDVWLNEGFASYAEALWDEHHKGKDDYAYNMWLKADGAISGGKDRPVIDHRYPAPWSMFDGRAYPKGAWLLHMLRQRLGEDAFWKCIQTYGNTYRLQSIETSDFRKVLERETGRDLDRFFYDWTQRPRSPVLEIRSEYLTESKKVELRVKQTQSGEAFHFPLTVLLQCESSSQLVTYKEEIKEKEHTFTIPVPGRPKRMEIDPEQAVLAEFKEDKGRDLWLAQLKDGSTVPSRMRAVKHFAQSRSDEDRETLIRALETEKFLGVQMEIVAVLGDLGHADIRQALVRGLQNSQPKLRRACAEQLGKFYHDTAAANALKSLLKQGDPSTGVEAAALASYAKLEQPDTSAVLLPWLDKPSHREVLRSAALRGLGTVHDATSLDKLIAWTKKGKPHWCRTAALEGLGRLGQSTFLSDDQRQQIVRTITACLEGEGSRVRGSAVEALRELGKAATPALAALKALSLHDPDDRVRDQAKRASEQIASNTPLPAEVKTLREQLERLQREQDQLKERLNKYEKSERKGKS
jgi:aminopeptidase N